MDWLWRCRLASTVASTPSSMAQDDRALEGEGVGGVSNRQALWPVRGDLGSQDSWHFLLRVRTWRLSPDAPRAALGSSNAITKRWVSGVLRVFPEHRYATFDAGQKVKGSLNGAEVARLCILHLPTSVAPQPRSSPGGCETGQAALWPVLNAAAPA